MKSATLAVLILSTLGVIQVGNAVDYCLKRYSCNGDINIGCNNNGTLAEACPADAQVVNMTDDLIAAILDSHNTKRLTLVNESPPGATRMRILTWNAELARLASFNVKRCVFNYDFCHKTAEYKQSVQNIAKTWWTGPPPAPDDRSVILSEINYWWFRKQRTSEEISSHSLKRSFKVMASENNVELGCAAIKYTDAQFYNDPSLTLVCNYGRILTIG